MWLFEKFSKIIDPYLTILNALPKVALGPLIIIWIGASNNSIIFMAIIISIFITIINIYNGFSSTNKNYILLLKSLNANKKDIYNTRESGEFLLDIPLKYEDFWLKYKEPLILNKNGIFTIIFDLETCHNN